jgi:hypothetical protein
MSCISVLLQTESSNSKNNLLIILAFGKYSQYFSGYDNQGLFARTADRT